MKQGRISALAAVIAVVVAAGGVDRAEEPARKEGVAAYVRNRAITLDDVDSVLGTRLAKIRQEEYSLRRSALDALVAQMLLEGEADSRGITVDRLIASEIDAKAGNATPEEVEAYFRANKSRNRSLQGKTIDEARPRIESELRRQKLVSRRKDFIRELKAAHDVRIVLDPPRADVPIPAGEPAKGPEDAPVTIVEFSDFQCGFCRRAEDTVEQLLEEFGDRVRLVYRDFPLRNHARATPAAVAARCAGEQDRYWEFHDNLFRVRGDMSDTNLNERAQSLELNMEEFTACYDSNRYAAAVQQSVREGSDLGVSGTPTFFINGRMIVGAKPYDELRAIIEEELDLAAERTANPPPDGGAGGSTRE